MNAERSTGQYKDCLAKKTKGAFVTPCQCIHALPEKTRNAPRSAPSRLGIRKRFASLVIGLNKVPVKLFARGEMQLSAFFIVGPDRARRKWNSHCTKQEMPPPAPERSDPSLAEAAERLVEQRRVFADVERVAPCHVARPRDVVERVVDNVV